MILKKLNNWISNVKPLYKKLVTISGPIIINLFDVYYIILNKICGGTLTLL